MNKSTINVPSAGTEDHNSTTAQNKHVSQPNANTNVVGTPFQSREIKFRAWHTNEKKWWFFDLFDLMCGHTDIIDNRYRLEHRTQYAGLNDKIDKEIYEGDIVEANGSKTILVKDNSDARRFVSPIFKDEYKSYSGRFLFVVYWQNCFSQFSFNPLDPMVSIECNIDKRDFEIIGNVFENPELLHSVA